MKKFLTLALLAGSLVIVGCNNSNERKAMEKILGNGEFLVNKCISDSLVSDNPDLSNKINKPNGQCLFDLGDFSIVDESAEGDDRVVIKRWIDGFNSQMPCRGDLLTTDIDEIFNKDGGGCFCVVNTNVDDILAQVEGEDNQKINKELCWQTVWEEGHWEYWGVEFPEDFDLDKLGQAGELGDFVQYVFGWSFNHFGELKYEPADNEFFYHDYRNGGHVLFSETVGSLKDLELMGSRVEENNALDLGEKLSAQYGLSEERGLEVAKTVSIYNKLTSKRALTPREMDKFTNKLLGVNYKDAEKGIKSGDQDEFNALMEKAADVNGTSPEAMTEIIKDMVL